MRETTPDSKFEEENRWEASNLQQKAGNIACTFSNSPLPPGYIYTSRKDTGYKSEERPPMWPFLGKLQRKKKPEVKQ